MNLFKRGIHPHVKKVETLDYVIGEINDPESFVVPLAMHIGAPAKLIVKKGDKVKVGELIGEKSSFVSANIFSPTDGIVKDIINVKNTLGKRTLSVLIEPSSNPKSFEMKVCSEDTVKGYTPAEVLSKIEKAGIVGLGGAGFPTNVKMNIEDRNVDHLIINACECEPFLNCDNYMIVNYANELKKAIIQINKLAGAKHIVFVVEDDKPKAIGVLKEVMGDIAEIKPVETRYPQGGEKQLIHTVTGKEIALGVLPIDLGVVVMNISTLYAVYEALYFDKPLFERCLCVVDDDATLVKVVKVKIGTKIGDVLTSLCIDAGDYEKIVLGGPMMGQSQGLLSTPVAKTTSAILLIKHPSLYGPTACIRCARCINACPMHLMPMVISAYSEKEDYDACEKNNAASCIECGCCSYVCPAKRPLMQLIKSSKVAIAMRKKK